MGEGQRRAWLSCILIALFFCIVGAFSFAGSALAFPYEFAEENIGSPGSGDGQLELGIHSGLAVNLTTDEIYVADSENHRVDVFNASGGFVRAFGADVGGAGIDVCTSSCAAGTSKDAPGAFESPTFIAIDNNPLSPSSGDVYVADNGTNTVSKFEADGDLVTSWGEGGRLAGSPSHSFDEVNGNSAEITGIAVDLSGNLFAKQTRVGGFMFKFDHAGTILAEFTTTFKTGESQVAASRGIAVDSTGALYIARGTEVVAKLDSTGKPIIESIGCEACTRAVTVDPSNDDLYIAQENKVERYNSAGVLQEPFGSSAQITKATGIAVNAGLETAYIADQGAGNDRIDVFGPPPPGPPEVKSTGVENITAAAADLFALVNPHLFDTLARFQYLSLEQFEAEGGFNGATETSELDLGAGKVPVKTGAHLSGLAPGTTYVFRVLAVNEAGEDSTDNHEPAPSFATFTTPPAGLPDNRAYEMVSPSQKVGEVTPPEPSTQLGGSCGDCLPGENVPVMPMQSAPNGGSVLYLGQPFFAGLSAGPNEYLASRTSSGWGTQSLSSVVTIGDYEVFSTDLTRGVLLQADPPLTPQAPTRGGKAFQNLYLRGDGQVEPLITEEPPNRSPGEFRVRFAAADAGGALGSGFGNLLFEANDALTDPVPGIAPAAPEVEAGGTCSNPGVECNLYEWQEGELALVNVLPDNENAADGAVIGAGRLLGSVGQHPDVSHAISDDGSRVFFSAQETGKVYVRVDGEETLEIPTLGPGTCQESDPVQDRACFLTASADGTSVLLSDGQVYELNEARSGYEPAAELSEGKGGFKGILGAAEDLSRIYFVDTEALTEESEENENGEHAEEDELNLYGWDEGELTFIGMLLPDDGNFNAPEYGAWTASPSHRTAQVSPDGNWLAFMSLAPLSGYDSTRRGGEDCRSSQTPACREVFVYSADAKTLSCASCNPTGQQPLGDSNLSLLRAGPSRPAGSPFPQPGNLARDGSGRLFFESQDELSPRDTNGNIQDVYEWEPNGVGSCEQADGCIYLLSSGISPNDSMFLDSSLNGDDAFFITRQQLLPRDKNQQLDLYDARVGGGLQETAVPPCSGEECPAPPAGVPARPRFGSSNLMGGPEKSPPTKPKHCKKGFVKKHGKCVKKKPKKHKRGGSK